MFIFLFLLVSGKLPAFPFSEICIILYFVKKLKCSQTLSASLFGPLKSTGINIWSEHKVFRIWEPAWQAAPHAPIPAVLGHFGRTRPPLWGRQSGLRQCIGPSQVDTQRQRDTDPRIRIGTSQ